MDIYSLTDSLQRFWKLIWRGNREGDNAHPCAAQVANGETNGEAGQSPGLRCSELEELFGRDIQTLNLEKVDAGSDGHPLPVIKWSRDNVKTLIDALGARALNKKNEDGMSLVHLTLIGGRLECARLLFDYASEEQCYVRLSWKDGNILAWAVDNKSKSVAEFVLQRMAEQCSSPAETADCLRYNFEHLVKQFPQVMQNYVTNDRFCFEYGRFDVPQSLFADRPDTPIAALGEAPSSWKPAEGTNDIKEFWERNGLSELVDLDSTSDSKISAVSKFLCIDLSNAEDQQNVLKSLLSAKYPADVFKTHSIKNFVQWIWIVKVSRDAVVILLFDVLASSQLFLFVAAVWADELDYSGPDKDLAVLVFFAILIARYRSSMARRLIATLQCGVLAYFSFTIGVEENTAKHLRLATSILCVTCLFVLIEDLRPFNLTGPFISMIGYVLMDIRPFIVLGTLMIIVFGSAFHVLFADPSDEGGREGFRTVWLSFESMFHATIGQFEPEVFHSSPTSLLSIWRSLLFNLFLFMAAIVVLSLLIAVLGDTCDRVMLAREAESIKSRAACLSGWTWKELGQDVVNRMATGRLHRMLYSLLDWFSKMPPVVFPVMIFLVLPFAVGSTVHAIQHWGIVAAVLLMIASGIIILSLLGRDTLLENVFVRDPFLRRLNSHQVGLGVSVFWFLVPAAADTSSLGVPWEGRLKAISTLVSERLKETEENQRRDITRLEDRLIELAAALHQQMKRMHDRCSRIEGFLEQTTHSTP